MKKIIAKNRADAIQFVEAGAIRSQRVAYWREDGKCYRAERVPGDVDARITDDCGGLWWSATKTIAEKLGV